MSHRSRCLDIFGNARNPLALDKRAPNGKKEDKVESEDEKTIALSLGIT